MTEQQLPKARSRITQHVIEKPADVVSRALERTPARNVPGLKLATSSMRASKAAGREAAQETVRESAALGASSFGATSTKRIFGFLNCRRAIETPRA